MMISKTAAALRTKPTTSTVKWLLRVSPDEAGARPDLRTSSSMVAETVQILEVADCAANPYNAWSLLAVFSYSTISDGNYLFEEFDPGSEHFMNPPPPHAARWVNGLPVLVQISTTLEERRNCTHGSARCHAAFEKAKSTVTSRFGLAVRTSTFQKYRGHCCHDCEVA